MAKVLVTGVSGFVGKALAERLIAIGHEVRGLSRNDPKILGLSFIAHDLSASTAVPSEALKSFEAVFHTAAKVDMWGKYDDFYQTNVLGTKKILAAAQREGVKAFVFTSSPSVVAGEDDLCGIDESQPYPAVHQAAYPATKAEAERMVLAAASPKFRTCALRPHLIYGPGDRNFAPLILARAKSGRLRQIGDGKNLVDFSYIDDCVTAHILAFEGLLKEQALPNGKAYFISQGQPYPLWQWIRELLAAHNLQLPSMSVPKSLAYGVASLMERFSKLSGYRNKPLLTKFLIHQMTTNHYFSIEAARRDLGYAPSVSIKDGLIRTAR